MSWRWDLKSIEFSGYELLSGVLDDQHCVDRVTRGVGYGHVVRTTRYYQLYPVDITVTSSLADTKQLKFRDDQKSWQWDLHLNPFHCEMEETDPLECLAIKHRDKDRVTVLVTGGDTGRLELPLKID
jgi:hypothetical protein